MKPFISKSLIRAEVSSGLDMNHRRAKGKVYRAGKAQQKAQTCLATKNRLTIADRARLALAHAQNTLGE